MTKTTTSEDFGSRMRQAREAAGMSQADAVYAVRGLLPRTLWISQSKLHRLEAGRTAEEDADPFLVGVLATAYGAKVADLSPAAVVAMDKLAEVASRSRCDSQMALALGAGSVAA